MLSPGLLFLFVFQAVMAGGLAWLLGRWLGPELQPQHRRRIRQALFGAWLCLPGLLYLIFRHALPEGQDPTLPLQPAVWMAMILSALLLGWALGSRPRSG